MAELKHQRVTYTCCYCKAMIWAYSDEPEDTVLARTHWGWTHTAKGWRYECADCIRTGRGDRSDL